MAFYSSLDLNFGIPITNLFFLGIMSVDPVHDKKTFF